jgi:hypothetical protein
VPFAFWFVRGRRFFRGVDRYSRGIESEKRSYLFVTLSLTGPRDGSSASHFSLGGVLSFPSVVSSLKTEMPRSLGAMLSMRAVKRMINVRGDGQRFCGEELLQRIPLSTNYIYVIVWGQLFK